MKSLRIGVLVILASIVLNQPASAKSEFDLVTVAGPDWYGDIELVGSDIPSSLVLGGFFDPQQPVNPPAGLDRGYLITRGYEDENERYLFDRMLYFPGAPGYVYYLEIIDGSGPYDGHWFRVMEGEGRALLSVLEAKGVRLPDFPPAAHDSVSEPGDQNLVSVNSVTGTNQALPLAEVVSRQPDETELIDGLTSPLNLTWLVAASILLGALSGWVVRGVRVRNGSR